MSKEIELVLNGVGAEREIFLKKPHIYFQAITALRLCKNFLAEHFWTRHLLNADDTARRLKEGKLLDSTEVMAAE